MILEEFLRSYSGFRMFQKYEQGVLNLTEVFIDLVMFV